MANPEAWRDPANYRIGKVVKCGGCGKRCHETYWGKWCYKCNIARIERINATFKALTDVRNGQSCT